MEGKKLKEVNLGVKRGQFRMDDPQAEHNDEIFIQMREKIKKRDDFTCYYCQFRSMKYQEVHHIDDNHSNNAEDNLTTVCPLCHSCKHIGLAGLNEKGFLIKYPGVNQVEINILMRMLWIGKDLSENNDKMRNLCDMIISEFDKLRVEADKDLTSDPAIFSTVLLRMNDEEYKNRQTRLKGFLLIPYEIAYKDKIRYWSENNFKGLPIVEWEKMARKQIIEKLN